MKKAKGKKLGKKKPILLETGTKENGKKKAKLPMVKKEVMELLAHRKRRIGRSGGNRNVKIKDKAKKTRKAEKINDVLLAIKTGLPVSKAMAFVGLSNFTFYDWKKVGKQVTNKKHKYYDKEHPLYRFNERVEEAKSTLERVAKRTIYNSLILENQRVISRNTTDMPNTKWYAERKLRDEFGKRLELTGPGGKDLVPEAKKKAIKKRLKELLK